MFPNAAPPGLFKTFDGSYFVELDWFDGCRFSLGFLVFWSEETSTREGQEELKFRINHQKFKSETQEVFPSSEFLIWKV